MASLRDSLGFLLPPVSVLDGAVRTVPLNPIKFDAKLASKWEGKSFIIPPGESTPCPQHLPDFKDMKTLLRQGGLPTSLRPGMWFWLSGGLDLQNSMPKGHYQSLAGSTCNVDDTTTMSIENGCSNLHGAFQHHGLLTSAKGSEVLARIMYATVQHHALLKYSRSLHQLAAFVLVVNGVAREEQAFWTIVALVQNKLFPATQGQVTVGSFVEQGVLERLVAKKMPAMSAHMIGITAVTASWYKTAFTSHLPPETCARVWDSMLCEGNKVMHRVALALLKRYEAIVVGSSQQIVLHKILDMRVSRITASEELMQAAFKGVGSMPSSRLSHFRQEVLVSPELARLAAVHKFSADLRLEQQPAPLTAALPPSSSQLSASLKTWTNGGMRSKGASMASSAAASSCSDGYSSGDSHDVLRSKTRTASGRRVTISEDAATVIRSAAQHVPVRAA